MEKITISKEEYHKLKEAYIKLKRLEEIDFDLIKQFKDSLELELNPEYLEKLNKIREGRYLKFSSIEELEKATS